MLIFQFSSEEIQAITIKYSGYVTVFIVRQNKTWSLHVASVPLAMKPLEEGWRLTHTLIYILFFKSLKPNLSASDLFIALLLFLWKAN